MTEIIEEHVPMKIKYEYLNEKGEPQFSKEFEVQLSLEQDNFEENAIIIVNECDFQTREERMYYHMFDPDGQIFITKAEQLKDFKNQNKTIVMKNCSVLAKQIVETLREEETRYKLGKNINIDNSNGPEIPSAESLSTADGKKLNQIKLIIFNLKKNYLDVDMFSEEFISYEGIKYLISFLQFTKGNLRTYAVEVLNKLLDFQSATDYIHQKIEIIDTLYEILMKNDYINCSLYILNILISIISRDDQKVMYLINVAENYAKKSVTKTFSQIVSLLETNEKNTKGKTLFFINVLLNFCDPVKIPRLLQQLKEARIYEVLEKVAKNAEKDFQEQLTNFQIKTGVIISGSDHELVVYKKKVEEMKEKCKETEKKYEKTIEMQLMYENIIEELLLYQNDINNTKGFFDHLAPKKRYGAVQDKPKIKYDENGIFDFLSILKNDINDSSQQKIAIFEKYLQTRNNVKELEGDIKELEIKQKKLIDDKVNKLKTEIYNSTKKREELQKEYLFLDSKVKELEEEISKRNIKVGQKDSASSKPPEESNTPPVTGPVPPPPPPPPPPPGVPSAPGAPGVPPPPGPPPPPGAPIFNIVKGPQPTKPKIKLKMKVKPLQWSRILLLPENDPKRTDLIWNNIKEPDIDIDEITTLFSVKKKVEPKKAEKKDTVKKKTFLDSKRAQEVGISLAKLPKIDVISRALMKMDDNILTEANIKSLLLIAMTKEELDIYKAKGSDGIWEKNEQYLIELNEIPNYKEKLKIWSIIMRFEYSLPRVEEAFEYMIPACDEIKESKHFHEILATILSLGNILNASTSKGQADGFSLDLLPKMSGMKDSLGHSILTYICSKTNKDDPSFEGFNNKFPYLEKASGFSLNETKKKLDELNTMVKVGEKLLNSLKSQDEFINKATNFLEGAKDKVKSLQKKEEKNKEYYRETVKYFGYKDTDKYYDENGLFFKMLLEFFKEVDKQMPKFEVKRIADYQNRVVGKKVNQNELMRGLMSQLKQKIQG